MIGDINLLLGRVVRRWWLIALITLLAVGAASWQAIPTQDRVQAWLCINFRRDVSCRQNITVNNRYRTISKFVLGANPSLPQSEFIRIIPLINSPITVGTAAEVLQSQLVASQAAGAAQIPVELRSNYVIRVTEEPSSSAFRITIEGPDPATTERLSAAMRETTQNAVDDWNPLFALRSLDVGDPRAEKVETPWLSTLVLTSVAGVALGGLVALWFDALVRPFRKDERNGAMRTIHPVTPDVAHQQVAAPGRVQVPDSEAEANGYEAPGLPTMPTVQRR